MHKAKDFRCKLGQGAIVIGITAIIIGEVLLQAFFKKASFLQKFVCNFGKFYLRLNCGISTKMGLNTDDLKLFTQTTIALAMPTLMKNNAINIKWQ